MPLTPVETRARKGSIKDSVHRFDAEIILESEERIKACFKKEISKLVERLDNLENVISSVQGECVRLDEEVTKIKNVICEQQLKIEKYERHMRADNIIIHNIPEQDVFVGTEKLKEDIEKINFVCQSARVDVTPDKIHSFKRLGKRKQNKSRPLKVTFKDKDHKYIVLNKRKDIASNEKIREAFQNKVFVNPDCSFLVQKEELRLRESLKRLKKEKPTSSSYLRSGKLYLDDEIFDEVDVRNQLF